MKDVIYVRLVWSTNRKFYKHYNLFDDFRKMARCRKCCTSHQDIAAMGNLINWYVVLPPQPKPTAWHFAFRFWFLSQFWINYFSKKQLLSFPLIMPASRYGTNTEAKTENGLGNFGAKLSLTNENTSPIHHRWRNADKGVGCHPLWTIWHFVASTPHKRPPSWLSRKKRNFQTESSFSQLEQILLPMCSAIWYTKELLLFRILNTATNMTFRVRNH